MVYIRQFREYDGVDMWNTLAEDKTIEKTVAALKNNGIEAIVVEDKEAAVLTVKQLIVKKSEVMMMTSRTLEETGIAEMISNSGDYVDVHQQLLKMDRVKMAKEMRQMRAAPDYSLGSVHAITTDGKLIIASNTGSQLPAYAYGAGKVIFIAGAQKITADLDAAQKRLYEYVLPLESERAHQAYGSAGSFVSKLLIINKEIVPNRMTVVIVKQILGF